MVVLAVVAAACSDDDGPLDAVIDDTTTGSTLDDETPSADPPAPTEPGTPAPADPGEPPAAPPDATPTPPSTGAPTTAGVTVPREGAVGSYGPWYLRADAAASIVVEVRSQSGAEPTGTTVERIRSVLQEVSGKSVTTAGGTVPGGARQWNPDDIRAEADRTGPPQRREAAVLTLLFLRGGLDGADQTIGVAVRSDVAAVFSDKVDEASGPFVGSARIEQAVTTHEVGHLLGLVDLVLDTGRDDPEHPGHSTNRASVMYFAVESTLVGDLLGGGPPTDFDDADRADLRSIAGR